MLLCHSQMQNTRVFCEFLNILFLFFIFILLLAPMSLLMISDMFEEEIGAFLFFCLFIFCSCCLFVVCCLLFGVGCLVFGVCSIAHQ